MPLCLSLAPSRRTRSLVVSTAIASLALAGCSDSSGLGAVAENTVRFMPIANPVDITPNGSTALLQDFSAAASDFYFFDVTSGVLTLKGNTGSNLVDFVTGISSDLRVSAIHGVPGQAGLWSQAGGWLDLGSLYPTGCDVNVSSAWDISADGKVAVGMGWDVCSPLAFKWSEATGTPVLSQLQTLGTPMAGMSGHAVNRATKISDDGLIAAGWASTDLTDRWPAVWRANGSGFLLTGPPTDWPGEVLAINANGSMVAGVWNLQGFYWTAASGTVLLDKLPGMMDTDPCPVNAIADGTQLLFGVCGDGFNTVQQAWVWTSAAGVRSLEEVAVANGVTLPNGYHLGGVVAASTDGTVVLGWAYDSYGKQNTFVLHLPVSAYGL
jgi:uncharacterized membrane protein